MQKQAKFLCKTQTVMVSARSLRTHSGLAALFALAAAMAQSGCTKPTPAQYNAWSSGQSNGPVTVDSTGQSKAGYTGQVKPLQGSFNE